MLNKSVTPSLIAALALALPLAAVGSGALAHDHDASPSGLIKQNTPPPLVQDPGGPPPLPQQPAVEYYVAQDGQPVGPLSLSEVEQMIRGGNVAPDTLVWKSGTEDWQAASAFSELEPYWQAAGPEQPRSAEYFSQFLLGTWEEQLQIENVQYRLVVQYTPDGRFQGMLTAQTQGGAPPQPPTQVGGTWQVQAVDENRFTLLSNETVLGGGQSSFVLRIVDDNTMVDDEDGATSRRIAR